MKFKDFIDNDNFNDGISLTPFISKLVSIMNVIWNG